LAHLLIRLPPTGSIRHPRFRPRLLSSPKPNHPMASIQQGWTQLTKLARKILVNQQHPHLDLAHLPY